MRKSVVTEDLRAPGAYQIYTLMTNSERVLLGASGPGWLYPHRLVVPPSLWLSQPRGWF